MNQEELLPALRRQRGILRELFVQHGIPPVAAEAILESALTTLKGAKWESTSIDRLLVEAVQEAILNETLAPPGMPLVFSAQAQRRPSGTMQLNPAGRRGFRSRTGSLKARSK